MPQHKPVDDGDPRPEFMIVLGLAPPYLMEDVQQAYRTLAKKAHPDAGGTIEKFHELQTAYERAQVYLEHRKDRRGWIAAQVSRYVELETAVDRLGKLGATVKLSTPNWLQMSFGDFAQLTETATLVRAENIQHGDQFVATLVGEHHAMRELQAIEMPGCKVSDKAISRLRVFQQLRRLDLSNTPIGNDALAIVDEVPTLDEINLEGTSVGWWAKRRVNSKLRRRKND